MAVEPANPLRLALKECRLGTVLLTVFSFFRRNSTWLWMVERLDKKQWVSGRLMFPTCSRPARICPSLEDGHGRSGIWSGGASNSRLDDGRTMGADRTAGARNRGVGCIRVC